MEVVELTKNKLGLTSDSRDAYLTTIVDAIKADWEHQQGMVLDYARLDVMDLLADYACYRYKTHDPGPMPRHLQYRLRTLWTRHAGGRRDG